MIDLPANKASGGSPAEPGMSSRLAQIAVRTSLIFWIVAVLYIVLSDRVVDALLRDPVTASRVQTAKGWAFVTVTALLIYVGLRSQLRRWEAEITERRRAEQSLRTRMTQIQAVLAHQPIAFFAFDRAGVFLLWEGKTWPDVNFPPADVVGRNVLECVPPQPDVHAAIRRAMQGETITVESRIGTRTFEIFQAPLLDAGAQVVGTTGVMADITERKKLEAQLLRAQRLESVGRLAGGIAHDLNNILAPVLMGAGLLRGTVTDPNLRSVLEAMETSARRGATIIRQLLMFSRGVEGSRGPVLLSALLTEMRNIVRETFPKNIAVRWSPSAELGLVKGDATQLHQVLLNLCVNARDAMPEGGVLAMGLEAVDIGAAAEQRDPAARPGPYIVLQVSDTGTGIAPEHLDQIFEPFFTTKEPGVGTGLGLSTVLGIVHGHGGFVEVQSVVGEGSTFRVYLPAASPVEAVAHEPAPAPPPRGHGECILVVDDEESVRRVARQALELSNYQVLVADDGSEGLAQFIRHRDTVKVVITDLSMPAMDGVSLVRALRDLASTVPVITMTGVEHSAKVEEMKRLGVAQLLAKPFTADALIRTVQQLLPPTLAASSR